MARPARWVPSGLLTAGLGLVRRVESGPAGRNKLWLAGLRWVGLGKLGPAWSGVAGQGVARPDVEGSGKTGPASLGQTGLVPAGRGRLGRSRQDKTWQVRVRAGVVRPDWSPHGGSRRGWHGGA
jgi:hypothetical protein